MAEPPIGVRLRTALEEKGWSYTRLIAEMRKVASRQGKTLPTTATLIAMLSRWLNGHERPSRFYREILSGALGLDQAELESGNGHELRGHPRLRRRDRRLPPELAWSAPLLVDSFTTAASLVILWRYLRGDAWRDPWYAWTLVACATAVSLALNVAHAPDRTSAQLFAALPPVALLGALELLMSVARTGLPHTSRTPSPPARHAIAARDTAARTPSGNGHRRPAALTPPSCRTALGRRTRTRHPHPMRGARCGRWSPASAPAARP
jgi:transcriptional regulator with XRE-family HTH domain